MNEYLADRAQGLQLVSAPQAIHRWLPRFLSGQPTLSSLILALIHASDVAGRHMNWSHHCLSMYTGCVFSYAQFVEEPQLMLHRIAHVILHGYV